MITPENRSGSGDAPCDEDVSMLEFEPDDESAPRGGIQLAEDGQPGEASAVVASGAEPSDGVDAVTENRDITSKSRPHYYNDIKPRYPLSRVSSIVVPFASGKTISREALLLLSEITANFTQMLVELLFEDVAASREVAVRPTLQPNKPLARSSNRLPRTAGQLEYALLQGGSRFGFLRNSCIYEYVFNRSGKGQTNLRRPVVVEFEEAGTDPRRESGRAADGGRVGSEPAVPRLEQQPGKQHLPTDRARGNEPAGSGAVPRLKLGRQPPRAQKTLESFFKTPTQDPKAPPLNSGESV